MRLQLLRGVAGCADRKADVFRPIIDFPLLLINLSRGMTMHVTQMHLKFVGAADTRSPLGRMVLNVAKKHYDIMEKQEAKRLAAKKEQQAKSEEAVKKLAQAADMMIVSGL